ncbi:MAG: DUF2703 domain-containing protein [Chloroflexota bacterium]
MHIEFLYFSDCPSHDDALQRLRDVMAEEDVATDVTIISVETDEAAQTHQFIGSPTIRINGADIVPSPEQSYNLACRVYQWDDGRYSPIPSPDMIRRALQQAKQETKQA